MRLPRPPERKARTRAIINILYPPFEVAAEDNHDSHDAARPRPKRGAGGSRRKGPQRKLKQSLKLALDDIEEYVDLGDVGDTKYTHHCYVTQDSREHRLHGLSIGAPCCPNRDRGKEKITVSLLNWLANRGWNAEEHGRWMFLVATGRKILVGIASNSVWTESLRGVKTHFELSDDLEAALKREIEANDDNFTAKSKLRLLKIVQELCCGGADWKLIIMYSGLSLIDAVITGILVDKASLVEVVDLVAACQASLLNLLKHWTSETWQLLHLMRGEAVMDLDETNRFARSYIYQLHASMHDHFEDRMEHPPYSILCAPGPNIPEALKDKQLVYV